MAPCGCWGPNSDPPEEQAVFLTLEPCLRPPPSPHVLFWGGRDNRTHLSGVIESLQELTWLHPAAQMEGAHLPTGSAWVAFDGSGPAHQGGISISLANCQCTMTSRSHLPSSLFQGVCFYSVIVRARARLTWLFSDSRH